MNMKRFFGIGFALCVGVLPEAGRAVVPVTPGVMKSTLALVNFGAAEAHATVSFYDGSGKLAASSPQTLPPHGAMSLPMPLSGFEGSAGVASDQPLLALVMDVSADNKAREIYEGMGTATALSFPVYRHLGSAAQSSIITVQNPSAETEVKTTLRYFDENGVEQGSAIQTLAPSMRYDFDSAALLGKNSHTYTARVEADGPIAGMEQVHFLLDTAALRGLAAAGKGKRFFVNPVQRKGLNAKPSTWSEIYVQNAGTSEALVTAAFYTEKGVKQADVNRTIAPSGFAVFDTRNVLPAQFEGYAVVSGSGRLAVQWLAARNEGRRLTGFDGTEEGKAGAAWACTDVRRIMKPAQSNHLQILNTGKKAADIQFNVFAPTTGASLTKKTYLLKPKRLLNITLDAPVSQKAGSIYSALTLIKAQTGAKLTVTAINEFQDGGDAGYTCQPIP